MIKSRDEVLYLVHLMVRGLYDEIPEEPSASIFLPSVYKLAGWNSITGLTWHAARKLTSLELALRSEWERAALVTMFRRIQFDAEPDVPAEVEADVRIMDNVLRFLCVKKDEA